MHIENDPENLDRLLRAWKVSAQPPGDFRAQVWNRISMDEPGLQGWRSWCRAFALAGSVAGLIGFLAGAIFHPTPSGDMRDQYFLRINPLVASK